MRFHPTGLPGCFVIEPEIVADERGHFFRTFCTEEFADHGIDPRVSQCSLSYSSVRGTLRGLHYQANPHSEVKLVRCMRGRIYDVAVDIRPGSLSFAQWTEVELSSSNRLSLLVPEGFAHGFLTLEDECEVLYQMSSPYAPEAARGLAWDDPAIGIEWPIKTGLVMSEADRAWPRLDEGTRGGG